MTRRTRNIGAAKTATKSPVEKISNPARMASNATTKQGRSPARFFISGAQNRSELQRALAQSNQEINRCHSEPSCSSF
jgi:hypothetical protein